MKYRVYDNNFQDITDTKSWLLKPDGKLFYQDYDSYTGHPNAHVEDEHYTVLKSIECCLKIISNILLETIKAEDGESSIEKFKDVKSLATYLKAMNDVIIRGESE